MLSKTAMLAPIKVRNTQGQAIRFETPFGETLAELRNGEWVLSELGEAYGYSVKQGRLYEMNATYPVA